MRGGSATAAQTALRESGPFPRNRDGSLSRFDMLTPVTAILMVHRLFTHLPMPCRWVIPDWPVAAAPSDDAVVAKAANLIGIKAAEFTEHGTGMLT